VTCRLEVGRELKLYVKIKKNIRKKMTSLPVDPGERPKCPLLLENREVPTSISKLGCTYSRMRGGKGKPEWRSLRRTIVIAFEGSLRSMRIVAPSDFY